MWPLSVRRRPAGTEAWYSFAEYIKVIYIYQLLGVKKELCMILLILWLRYNGH